MMDKTKAHTIVSRWIKQMSSENIDWANNLTTWSRPEHIIIMPRTSAIIPRATNRRLASPMQEPTTHCNVFQYIVPQYLGILRQFYRLLRLRFFRHLHTQVQPAIPLCLAN